MCRRSRRRRRRAISNLQYCRWISCFINAANVRFIKQIQVKLYNIKPHDRICSANTASKTIHTSPQNKPLYNIIQYHLLYGFFLCVLEKEEVKVKSHHRISWCWGKKKLFDRDGPLNIVHHRHWLQCTSSGIFLSQKKKQNKQTEKIPRISLKTAGKRLCGGNWSTEFFYKNNSFT